MKALGIWCGTKKVGEIDSRDRRIVLRYAAEWLDDKDAFPLSPRLPLQAGEHEGDEPVTYLANLLPEGPLLSALTRLRRLPQGDVFALMANFGAEIAGAFSILPAGKKPSTDAEYESYSKRRLCDDLQAVRENVPLLGLHDELRLSLAGAQNKIAVYVSTDGKPDPDAARTGAGALMLPLKNAASSHILKPPIQPERDYPQSVDNEALCLALAGRGGLPAIKGEIFEACGERILLVERYDRVREEGGRLQRLHQLDFCQLTGRLPDVKYEEHGGPSLAEIFGTIRQYSAIPSRDVLTAVDWVAFNYLVGNADAHAKNLAMLPAGNGKFRLAPWYDILSTSFYPRATTKLAMKIGGEARPEWVRKKHWERFAGDTGVNSSLLRKRFADIGEQMRHNLEQVATGLAIPTDGKLVASMRKTIEGRLRWVLQVTKA